MAPHTPTPIIQPFTSSQRILFAFDCDNTLVDVDSDLMIAELGQPLPPQISALRDGHYWTDYMNAVYRHLFKRGIPISRISKVLSNLPQVRGMCDVLHLLRQQENIDVIIVSDASDFAIRSILSTILNSENFANTIPLISNRCLITDEGCLHVNPFHWQKRCSICPPNLCKGSALTDYLGSHKYDSVVYIGDGKNDVCPATRLKESDLILARKGYPLHHQLESGLSWNSLKVETKAPVGLWTDGNDIFQHLLSSFELNL